MNQVARTITLCVLLAFSATASCMFNPVFDSVLRDEKDNSGNALVGLLLLQTMFGCSSTLNLRQISSPTIDGLPTEYTSADLLVSDASGDSTGPAGTDIRNVYMAHDGAGNFLFYMELDALPPNGWAFSLGWGGDFIFQFRTFGGTPNYDTQFGPGWPGVCSNVTTDAVRTTSGWEVRVPQSCINQGNAGHLQGNSSFVQWVTTQDYISRADLISISTCVDWSY